jgi:hypothetical protein
MSYKEYSIRIHDNGTREYRNKQNQLHREDGPACEWADGRKYWYINGQLHREDGPAYEYANGDKYWFINNQLHREDGPACEYADGGKFWWINGKELTEAEFLARTKPGCEDKVVEIEGGKYRLVAE